jgi:RNA polymerase sigma-70 factor (ECF subfamily)
MDPAPIGIPDSPGPSASVELVRRIRDGDGEAFAELYRQYRDRLLFAIRCRMGAGLRAHVQSEDVLQSVMRDVIGDLPRFEPRGADALARYLHTCALNKLRGLARRWNAERRSGGVPLTDSMLGVLDGGGDPLAYREPARWERLERALALLPEPMRHVILLRQLDGLSNADAASALGKAEDATSKLFARAMARLTTLVRDADA